MRYTIGCEITAKNLPGTNTKKECKGIYAIDSLGLPFVLTSPGEEIYRIPVFFFAKDAELFAQAAARSLRRDDVWLNEKLKSRYIRRLFPLKMDSKKFPYKVILKDYECEEKLFLRNRFDEKTKNGVKVYYYYRPFYNKS